MIYQKLLEIKKLEEIEQKNIIVQFSENIFSVESRRF